MRGSATTATFSKKATSTLPYVLRSAALLELYARWDLGHADAPQRVLVEDSAIRFLPRRLQSALIRRRSRRTLT